jgi:hypothetical protein
VEGDDDNNNDRDGRGDALPRTWKTAFPRDIQASLQLYPPMELICIEGDGFEGGSLGSSWGPTSPGTDGDRHHGDVSNLPRFVLYSAKYIYLLQLQHHGSSPYSQEAVTMSCRPLLEEFLLDFATRVVRIRPAPQRSAGHAVYAPGGACVVLLGDPDGFDYQLVTIQVGSSAGRSERRPIGRRTPTEAAQAVSHKVALSFCVEQTPGETVVDFCFGLSAGPLAALSSLSVVLLMGSGDVYGASPIVLEGTIVPQARLQESIDTLDALLGSLDRATAGPRRRQVLAAQRYLQDVLLGGGVAAAQFSQAKFAKGNASSWTVQLQGPILFATTVSENDSDDSALRPALVVEALAAGDYSGLVVGRSASSGGGRCDWAVYSPVSILPRFSMENPDDQFEIDGAIYQHSSWVESTQLGYPTSLDAPVQSLSQPPMHLLVDPFADHLLHVVVPAGIYTVSTNIMHATSQRLGGATFGETHTTAWESLATVSSNPVCGAVALSTSAGHALLGRLADGTLQAVHVTQQQYRHEIEAIFPTTSPLSTVPSSSSEALAVQQMEKTLPHHEAVRDAVARLNEGLDGMQMLAGSQTRHKDMTPELLAVCLSINEHCEQKVLVPLLELKSLNDVRKKAIRSMVESQQDQLNALLLQKEDMERRSERIYDILERVEASISFLAERSARALAALQDTTPTLTQAEVDFGDFCQSLKIQAVKWEEELHSVTDKIQAQVRDTTFTSWRPELTTYVEHMKKLQEVQTARLPMVRARLFEADKEVRAVGQRCGMASTTP